MKIFLLVGLCLLSSCTLVQTTKCANVRLNARGASGMEPMTGILFNLGTIDLHWIRTTDEKMNCLRTPEGETPPIG